MKKFIAGVLLLSIVLTLSTAKNYACLLEYVEANGFHNKFTEADNAYIEQHLYKVKGNSLYDEYGRWTKTKSNKKYTQYLLTHPKYKPNKNYFWVDIYKKASNGKIKVIMWENTLFKMKNGKIAIKKRQYNCWEDR